MSTQIQNGRTLLSRAEFLRVALLRDGDLVKLLECGVVQRFGNDKSGRGKYFMSQAVQLREGRPVVKIDWLNQIQSAAHVQKPAGGKQKP